MGLPYVHLSLPMEFEAERTGPDGRKTGGPCRTYVDNNLFFVDPRTEEGELLFPERFPRKEVDGLKKSKGSYAYNGQYQQRPAPRDGGIFTRGWFEVVDAIPANVKRCRAWDFGGTDGGGDATVGLRMARAPDGVFYVERVDRDHLSPAKVEKLVKTVADTDPAGTVIRIPQDPAQAGKAQAQTYIKLLAGHSVKAVQPTGDKVVRASPASAQAEAGNVKLLRGGWNEAFLDEVCTFPSASHDDQVDAFADALNELALGSSYTWANLD
ncbi:phage terminase large subunit [Caulobacter sp. B11]|uniref:phage terminase large subunit n=1 Tax=Caulobacter sp. B11 TaxID=2048899 RepID=UPI00191BB147|nr:phage terminase large subunit [Caulobacter sp. B11]